MSITSYLCVNRQLSFHASRAAPAFCCIVHIEVVHAYAVLCSPCKYLPSESIFIQICLPFFFPVRASRVRHLCSLSPHHDFAYCLFLLPTPNDSPPPSPPTFSTEAGFFVDTRTFVSFFNPHSPETNPQPLLCSNSQPHSNIPSFTHFQSAGSSSSLPRPLLAIPHPSRTIRAFLSRCPTSNARPRRNFKRLLILRKCQR